VVAAGAGRPAGASAGDDGCGVAAGGDDECGGLDGGNKRRGEG
jgi:hypothetical protein